MGIWLCYVIKTSRLFQATVTATIAVIDSEAMRDSDADQETLHYMASLRRYRNHYMILFLLVTYYFSDLPGVLVKLAKTFCCVNVDTSGESRTISNGYSDGDGISYAKIYDSTSRLYVNYRVDC